MSICKVCSMQNTENCRRGDTVLNNPTSSENQIQGLVLTWYDGHWGTICDDVTDCDCASGGCTSNCDNSNVNVNGGQNFAAVVCRGMGYAGGEEINVNGGYGGWPIVVDGTFNHITGCAGTEDHLDDCNWVKFGLANCNHAEDVGVKCTIQSKYHQLNFLHFL